MTIKLRRVLQVLILVILYSFFNMNTKKKIALLAFLRQRSKEHKQKVARKFWLHPLVAVRYVKGTYIYFVHKITK